MLSLSSETLVSALAAIAQPIRLAMASIAASDRDRLTISLSICVNDAVILPITAAWISERALK